MKTQGGQDRLSFLPRRLALAPTSAQLSPWEPSSWGSQLMTWLPLPPGLVLPSCFLLAHWSIPSSVLQASATLLGEHTMFSHLKEQTA